MVITRTSRLIRCEVIVVQYGGRRRRGRRSGTPCPPGGSSTRTYGVSGPKAFGPSRSGSTPWGTEGSGCCGTCVPLGAAGLDMIVLLSSGHPVFHCKAYARDARTLPVSRSRSGCLIMDCEWSPFIEREEFKMRTNLKTLIRHEGEVPESGAPAAGGIA